VLAARVILVDGGFTHALDVISARRADQVPIAYAGGPGFNASHSGLVEHELVVVPAYTHDPEASVPWEVAVAYGIEAEAAADVLGRLSPTTLASPAALDDGVYPLMDIGLNAADGSVAYTT
jgi:hypothetical protein